jgi:hypothetical protein
MIPEKNKIEFVVSNFNDLESRLLECLSYVPYIDQNRNTISPKFIPIILETCSLIESIFKETLGSGKFSFKDYAEHFDETMELKDTVSILLTSPIQFLQPYKNWQIEIPIWWKIYNKLKHDRLNNFHLVTYDATVLSLSALHQLISKHRGFTNHLIERCWISPDLENIGELICARLVGDNCLTFDIVAAESKLFVSPLRDNFAENQNDRFYVKGDCQFSNRVRSIISIDEFDL